MPCMQVFVPLQGTVLLFLENSPVLPIFPHFPPFYPAGNRKVQALRHNCCCVSSPGRGGEDGELLKTQMLLLHVLFHSYPQTIPTKTAILSSSSRSGSKTTRHLPGEKKEEKTCPDFPGEAPISASQQHPVPFLVTPAGGKQSHKSPKSPKSHQSHPSPCPGGQPRADPYRNQSLQGPFGGNSPLAVIWHPGDVAFPGIPGDFRELQPSCACPHPHPGSRGMKEQGGGRYGSSRREIWQEGEVKQGEKGGKNKKKL